MAAPKINKDLVSKLKRLLQKERTVFELSEKCNVSVSTVYRYLEKISLMENCFLSASFHRPTKYQLIDLRRSN